MYHILAKYKLTSLHIMVVILGLTGVFGKLISLEALHLVWYRMGIAFLSLAIFLAFKKQLFSINKKDFIGILGVGALVTFHWLCFFESIKVSTVSVAVVCLATSSLFSAVIEPLFFKRKLLGYEVVMGVIVIIALGFVMGTETQYFWGYFYGIMAALLGTLFTLFNAKYIKKVGAANKKRPADRSTGLWNFIEPTSDSARPGGMDLVVSRSHRTCFLCLALSNECLEALVV